MRDKKVGLINWRSLPAQKYLTISNRISTKTCKCYGMFLNAMGEKWLPRRTTTPFSPPQYMMQAMEQSSSVINAVAQSRFMWLVYWQQDIREFNFSCLTMRSCRPLVNTPDRRLIDPPRTKTRLTAWAPFKSWRSCFAVGENNWSKWSVGILKWSKARL